jgi:hypothetical protein
VAMTAVSSAKVAVMESGEVGRSAVYRRYSKGAEDVAFGCPCVERGNVCEFSGN